MKLPARVTAAHYMTCQNPKCRRRKAVRAPSQAKRQRFCSKQCAGSVCGGWTKIPREVKVAIGRAAAARNRQRRMRELANESPIQIFRRAYRAGWQSGVRYMKRCAS